MITKNDKEKFNKLISKIRYTIIKDYAFYTDLCLNRNHKLVDSENFFMGTDAQTIYIGKKVLNMDFNDVMFIYLHELKHIALKHHELSLKYPYLDKIMLNISNDVIINTLTKSEIKPSNYIYKSGVFREKIQQLRKYTDMEILGMNSLEIYNILTKGIKIKIKLPKNKGKKKTKDNQNKDIENEPNKSNNNDNENNDISKELDKQLKELDKQLTKKGLNKNLKDAIKEAYKDYYFQKLFEKKPIKEKQKIIKQIKNDVLSGYIKQKMKNQGNINNQFEKIIDAMFKKVRNWKTLLRDVINETIKNDFSYSKPNDLIQSLHIAGYKSIGNLPSMIKNYDKIDKVIIGIDVSGSIDDDEYKDFLNEIYSLFKSIEINRVMVYLWDTETKLIYNKRVFQPNKVLEIMKKRTGYGGTDIEQFLNVVKKQSKNREILIIFTDGYIETYLNDNDFKKFKKTIILITKEGITERFKNINSKRINIIKMN